MIRPTLLVVFAAVCFTTAPARATLTIDVSYTGDPLFEPYFAAAATTWQNLLVGYQDGAIQAVSSGSSYIGGFVGDPLTTVYITAQVSPIDGPGMILGSAGPTEVALDAANYILATDGEMTFDSADAANLVSAGSFGNVVLHEMAHVLGFGTLWTNNNVASVGTGEFTGPNATAYWQSEFGQTGTPDVELDGGPGTANGHWNENLGGAGLVGITSVDGDLRNELMTGWLNSPTFISDMTIASFIDIGFTTIVAPVPEASGFLAMGMVFASVAAKRRRPAA
ncbi:hypothetical protein Pla108_23860 [Botrimarina colliarenosi]|uniref:Leishmanolysin n=1 Tax=Botrimarina colliarenosi TaxID=2528001 RepID=A0A5C6AB79_9BACT|nr:peptidase [Botrimarina colliarenosi]TWT96617.1 hypothetical protein Pla108_23860 [Botrimarina colliarenosi]